MGGLFIKFNKFIGQRLNFMKCNVVNIVNVELYFIYSSISIVEEFMFCNIFADFFFISC